MSHASVSIIILGFGAEPELERCLDAVLASRGIQVEVILVDNGIDPDVAARVAARSRVLVVGPPMNRGFTGGCNEGASRATSPHLAFLNSDAFVEDDAIAELVAALSDETVGISSASLRLDDHPELLNSAGNPVHFSGVTWAGAFGEPAAAHAEPVDIASATGAAMCMRREMWETLGGFDQEMFAYLEDTELSLRCWQLGRRVQFVPTAIVRHAYEFGRHDSKMYLLERNRILLVATLYERRSLFVLAPALVGMELLMLANALVSGWAGAKVRGWIWLLRNAGHVRRRRRFVQAARIVADRDWMGMLAGRIEPANVPTPPGMPLVNRLLDGYWRLAGRIIRIRGLTRPQRSQSDSNASSA